MQPGVKNDVAIIIPLKSQRDEYLKQCLSSALNQSFRCKVIAVTHPKTPLSNINILEEFLADHENLDYYTRSRHRMGFAAAINQGWENTKSDRIGLLLSDDWIDPDTIEQCLEFDSDIVSTGMYYHDQYGTKFLENRLDNETFYNITTLEARAGYLRHFYLFNREKLEQVGGVDETIGLTGADDYDLIWTLLEHNASVGITEKPRYHYRDHESERLTFRGRAVQIKDYRKILEKHGIHGRECDRLIEKNAIWFGRTIQSVLKDLQHDGAYW